MLTNAEGNQNLKIVIFEYVDIDNIYIGNSRVTVSQWAGLQGEIELYFEKKIIIGSWLTVDDFLEV